MSNASGSPPLGTAMVGGAIAMAVLDLLVRKNILTVDDVQGALTTAQSSLISSPTVHGSLDGSESSARSKTCSRHESAANATSAPARANLGVEERLRVLGKAQASQ